MSKQQEPRLNRLGQAIGFDVPGWTPRAQPPKTPMIGRFARVEPLDIPRHAFTELAPYRAWLERLSAGNDPFVHTIIDQASGKAVGIATYMRIDHANGVIEVGHINYTPRLQRKPAATEAMYLMMARVFDELGYRRYEWKCDTNNAPSRRAAERYGFQFEGIFRQAVVTKGRNRDTAWYAMTDRDWPALKAAYAKWLDPKNFDAAGNQRERLSTLIKAGR
jgi:RimJ/RimL family protein N-acetyltransferase